MDPTEEHADFAAYSASPALPPSFAAGAPIQDSSLASAPVGSDPLVAGIVARLAATAGAGTRPSLSEAHLNSSSGLFSLPGAVPCTVKALSSPGLLAALDEPISPLQAHCPMAVPPHASLECTAESNLARSLTSSRSRRARENPQMQPHEEFKKLPEAREGEHEREVKSRAVRGGNGERLGGVRVAGGRGIGNIEKREGGLVGEGGRARGMSIEQLEAEAGRTDARTDGLKRNSWLSGSRSRKRGNPMKQQRLLPSEDEVREAATDWPTLGTTLRRVLRMGGSGVDDRGGLGTGAAGAGAEPTGEAAAGAARSHGWSFCEGMEGAEGATCLAVDEEGLVQQGQEEQPKAALHLPAHPQAEQKQQQQEEEERHRQQELQWQQQEEQQQQQRIPLPPASKMPSIGGLWKPGRLGGDPRVMDYECRFCGKGFDSPRALGGHMNLHRKERKLEDVFLQEAEAQARAEIQLRQQQQLQLLLQQQQQQQEQQQQQGFQLHGQEQPLMLQNQQQWLLQQAKQPQGQQQQFEELLWQQQQQLQQQQQQQRQQNHQQQLSLQWPQHEHQQQNQQPGVAVQALPLRLSPEFAGQQQQQQLIPEAHRVSHGVSHSAGSRASAFEALQKLTPEAHRFSLGVSQSTGSRVSAVTSLGLPAAIGAPAAMGQGGWSEEPMLIDPQQLEEQHQLLHTQRQHQRQDNQRQEQLQLLQRHLQQHRQLQYLQKKEQQHLRWQQQQEEQQPHKQQQQQGMQQRHYYQQQQQQQPPQGHKQSVFTEPRAPRAVPSKPHRIMPSSLPHTPTSLSPHTPSWPPTQTPIGPSTHSNRSPPHHLLLPPLASDPFLSTLCPEVLQSLFLRSCPSETSPADAVTPRAVITASSFAPAHPASVPPSLPPLPAAAPPPITIPRVTVPSVTTFSQHPSSLSPPVTASQLRATPLDMLASVLPAAVTSGVTSDITSGRPVSAPPVAKKGQGQQVKSGGLQKTQQQQQQQPMEMTEEVIREMESLPVRSVAGAAQEAMQRASGDNLAWLRPHRQQLELLRKQQQEQQQEQELLTQLLALAEQQAQPGIGGVLEQQGKAGQQQGGSSQAEACVGSENVPQGGVEWVGGVRRGEGSVQDLTGLDWLPATSHLFDLSLPAVTMPAVTVPDVTIPDVTMPNVTVPGGAQSEPFPAVPYLTSGPLSSPLVTPSLIRPPVLAGSAVSTPAAAAPLTTPQYGSSAAGAATSHGPSGAAVTSHGPPGAAIPSPVVHGRSIPTASIPARLQSFPSLQPPIFLHQPNLAQQQQQQILTSRPVVSQQREASALTRRPLQGEGAGGSEEDELAQLEQLRQLLLLQEQLIRDQPGGEGLELKRQGLEGMKGVECCGDLNQQVETEGGIAGQEKLCCSEE